MEGCMYLGLERDVFDTGCFVDGMKNYKNEPIGSIFVVIIARGEEPETFLTVPFEQGNTVTVHPDRHLWSGGIHPPDTLVQVLTQIQWDGTGKRVFNIRLIDDLSLVNHDKAAEMINKLDKFRQQPEWFEWIYRETFRIY